MSSIYGTSIHGSSETIWVGLYTSYYRLVCILNVIHRKHREYSIFGKLIFVSVYHQQQVQMIIVFNKNEQMKICSNPINEDIHKLIPEKIEPGIPLLFKKKIV